MPNLNRTGLLAVVVISLAACASEPGRIVVVKTNPA